ncbi:Oidioi.mRNA.OKI2018_I69.PAR.g11920.t1.cds [Oikopleura dioica]|uniref:Oidioi.mRNA.OKI2018_I69.PAR.g11920.t1.cds n=1 Tax=Oikopleura dioica TaxID=34765 RepID=A0ABN7RXY7_OIKDI|nr:Oidioi.mRNA.OKI2018_I69.PAR.g11920.t1.cds [Oikopleura dioica]
MRHGFRATCFCQNCKEKLTFSYFKVTRNENLQSLSTIKCDNLNDPVQLPRVTCPDKERFINPARYQRIQATMQRAKTVIEEEEKVSKKSKSKSGSKKLLQPQRRIDHGSFKMTRVQKQMKIRSESE